MILIFNPDDINFGIVVIIYHPHLFSLYLNLTNNNVLPWILEVFAYYITSNDKKE